MTRNAYLALFETQALAVEFEDSCLSSGNEFLPTSARQVRDGAEPTEAYWTWLCSQVEAAE